MKQNRQEPKYNFFVAFAVSYGGFLTHAKEDFHMYHILCIYSTKHCQPPLGHVWSLH